MIRANDPALKSWVDVSSESDFPIQNLPFGIFIKKGEGPRAASIIGDFIIDLYALYQEGFFAGIDLDGEVFNKAVLNDFIALGKDVTGAVRNRLSVILEDSEEYDAAQAVSDKFLIPVADVEMKLPLHIGDYTDFYSSIEHATNVGIMFRDPANALLPNWRHLPVGYHGRASSITVSGSPVKRPNGQILPAGSETPVFSASKQVDFELEMAFVIGKENALGDAIDIDTAEEFIFGLMLFNDWSARDIQRWEYVPLGPFLAKNFGSTVSPWIVTLEALEPFRVPGPLQEPEVLPYLKSNGAKNYDINLTAELITENGLKHELTKTNFKYMYWNMCQQLAHHTVNGCNMRIGDVCASGTISGPEPGSFGSLLEIAWKGTRPVPLADGTTRSFVQDNDTICLKGYGLRNGIRIGFGEAKSQLNS